MKFCENFKQSRISADKRFLCRNVFATPPHTPQPRLRKSVCTTKLIKNVLWGKYKLVLLITKTETAAKMEPPLLYIGCSNGCLFGIVYIDNLNFEHEHCVGSDSGLGHALRSIGKVAGDVEHGFAAFAKQLKAFGETGNNARG